MAGRYRRRYAPKSTDGMNIRNPISSRVSLLFFVGFLFCPGISIIPSFRKSRCFGIINRPILRRFAQLISCVQAKQPGTESKAAQSDAVAASPDFRAKSGDFAAHIDNLCLHTISWQRADGCHCLLQSLRSEYHPPAESWQFF